MNTRLAKLLPVLLAGLILGACGGGSGNEAQPPSTGIGPQGGTASGAYGAQVIVPSGALASNVDIAIARDSTNAPEFPPSGTGAAGAAFEITPHGTTFTQPATVRIPFDAAQVPADATPKIYKAELNGAFAEIPTTVDGNMLVANVTSFSWVIPAYASTRPRNVYVLTSGGVSSYRITATTGALTGPTSTALTGEGPSTVVAHPSGRFAYVTNGGSASANGVNPNSISVYKLDAISGAISGPTSTAPTSRAAGGQQPVSAIVGPTGQFVYVVNYGQAGGSTDVSVYIVNGTTGALSGPTSTADSGGAPPTAIAIDPSGKFAYVTYVFRFNTPFGNTYGDQVKVFSVNATTGELTGPTGGIAARTPWSIAVEPTGHYAYVASRDGDEVRTYGIDATTGALTFLGSTSVQRTPASIAVDSRGRFLYVGKQLPLSNASVEAYKIDAASGALSPAGGALVSGATPGPIAVVAEPQGEFVYAVASSQTSEHLTAFKVDATTGALTSAGAAGAGVVVPGSGTGVGIPFSFAATGTSPIWVNGNTFCVGCIFGSSGGGGGGGGGGGVGGGSSTHFLSMARGVWGGSIISSPAGIDWGDPTKFGNELFSAGFPNGTVVQLCETPFTQPAQVYDIAWMGACSGTTRCINVRMDSDKQCSLDLTPRLGP
jgi:6-phosphogluconolactonase (cycloisomerase 2 family)